LAAVARGARALKPAFVLALAALIAGARAAQAKPLHHYVYFMHERERIAEASFLQTPAFEGAQIMYVWNDLEPEKGVYDFSSIQKDLDFLSSKGKRLFIQIQDVTFSTTWKFVPAYLLKDPAYHGGADLQYDRAKPEGWVARRWDPAVRERFQALLAALGRAFDGKIEGINLPETAVGIGDDGDPTALGFTPAAYRDGILEDMKALKKAFPKSVALQYANFMPGEWLPDDDKSYLRSVYLAAERLGVGVGGPDLLPYKRGQMNHAYRFIRESGGAVPVGIAVQDGNYEWINPQTSRKISIRELIAFAHDFLRADYIFWCTEEPGYSKELIPYLTLRSELIK
jgi:hypothetical protein